MIITLCFNLNGGYVGHIRRFFNLPPPSILIFRKIKQVNPDLDELIPVLTGISES
jgi:hypothetical protein